jgi:DNA-binding NarL/FixJ family response regulator
MPRELNILRLVLIGRTDSAIAMQLFVTEKTIEFHLAQIYSMIGVRTRLMAALWATQQGMATETRDIPG